VNLIRNNKRITILIDSGTHSCHNVGDLAMLKTTVARFKSRFSNVECRVFTDSPERLLHYIPDAVPVSLKGRRGWFLIWNVFGGVHRLLPKRMHDWLFHIENKLRLKSPDVFHRWIKYRLANRDGDVISLESFFNEVKSADAVVASGGGYITDPFKLHTNILLQTLVLAGKLKKPTALFGQGLGPVHAKDLNYWAKCTLPSLQTLTLRESLYSKPFAENINDHNIRYKVTGDDAIKLAFQSKPKKLGVNLGVNIRIASYAGINENTVAVIRRVLANAEKKYLAKLLPVPISILGEKSDFSSLKLLLNKDIPIEEQRTLNSPELVIGQVGRCRIVVTGSYHAGVFALSQGISVVAIIASEYYRHKFEGLGSQFLKGCYIIDQNKQNFEGELNNAIGKAWGEAENLREQLLERAQLQIDEAELAYDGFVSGIVCK